MSVTARASPSTVSPRAAAAVVVRSSSPSRLLSAPSALSAVLDRLRRRSYGNRRALSAVYPYPSARPSRSNACPTPCFICASVTSVRSSCVAPSRCAISYVLSHEYETPATVARRGATSSDKFVRVSVRFVVWCRVLRVACETFCA